MSERVEHDAADQIRRLMAEDDRFPGVSGATALRHADQKVGWQDAGYFSFERDGRRYFVTVERADADQEVLTALCAARERIAALEKHAAELRKMIVDSATVCTLKGCQHCKWLGFNLGRYESLEALAGRPAEPVAGEP